MFYRLFKLQVILVLVLTAFFAAVPNTSFAAEQPNEVFGCNVGDPSMENPPDQLKAIACVIQVGFNVVVLSAGAVFAIMGALTAIKLSLSQGDPKALEAAKGTFTNLVLGFIIVIGVYTLFYLILGIFGVHKNLFESLTSPDETGAIDILTNWIKSN